MQWVGEHAFPPIPFHLRGGVNHSGSLASLASAVAKQLGGEQFALILSPPLQELS